MQKTELGSWLLRSTILALAILVVAKTDIVDGVHCDDGLTLIAVVVLLSVLNLLLRPLLMLVAMPLIIASFGLLLLPAIWVANAAVLYLVGNTFGLAGFRVETFGAALWASLWISIIGFLLGKLFGDARRTPGTQGGSAKKEKPDDSDVIDV